MIIDLHDDLPDLSSVDVCVVGGGAAGITLAVELASTGQSVAVLEEGGTTAESALRNVYQVHPGTTVTLGTAPDRALYLGGNTNHWYGNCRPLEAHPI